jgi:hypothetical protein
MTLLFITCVNIAKNEKILYILWKDDRQMVLDFSLPFFIQNP